MKNILHSKKVLISFLVFSVLVCSVYGKKNDGNEKKMEYYKTMIQDSKIDLQLRIRYGDSALLLSKKQKNKLWEVDILNNIGAAYAAGGKFFKSIEYTNQGLRLLQSLPDSIKSPNYKRLYYICLNNNGYSYAYCADYGKALELFNQLIRTFKKDSMNKYVARGYLGLSYVYCTQKFYKEAEKNAKKALSIAEREKDTLSIYGAHANLGDIYLEQGKYNEALKAYIEQQKIAIENDFGGKALVHSLANIAEIYHKKNQNEMAIQYFELALNMVDDKDPLQKITIQSYFGIFLYNIGNYDKAEKILLEVTNYKYMDEPFELQKMATRTLSKVYKKKGNLAKSLYFLEKSTEISDSMYVHITSERINVLEKNFSDYRASAEAEIYKQNLILIKEKLYRKNLWIIIICLAGLLILAIVAIISRKLIVQKNKNKILKDEIKWIHLDQERKMESANKEISGRFEEKYKQLISNTLTDAQYSEAISDLKQKFYQLKIKSSKNSQEANILNDIEQILHSISSKKQWEEFKILYEQIDSKFYENLQKDYSDLTPTDLRLCALISLNLSTKEIASITNKSVRGIESAKFRLRKRMRVSVDTNLYAHILSYKHKNH